MVANDFARLWINNQLMLNNWQGMVASDSSAAVKLTGGVLHEVVLEYLELTGEASASLLWALGSGPFQVVPQESLFALFEIDRSPVKVTVRGGEGSADNTTAGGVGLTNGTALHNSTFTVCPRDKFGNYLDDGDDFYASTQFFSAELHFLDDLAPDGRHYNGTGPEFIVPSTAYNFSSHCFEFAYTPQMAGNYRMDVFFQQFRDDPRQPLLGSPFFLAVLPDKASGPHSNVRGLPMPLNMESGRCFNFTVVTRDNAQNYRLVGGDSIEVYMYQVDWYHPQLAATPWLTFDPTALPSASPTAPPSSAPTKGPTLSPAGLPTFQPTRTPSLSPSRTPSLQPSRSPTSRAPTQTPSSMFPTSAPTTDAAWYDPGPPDSGVEVVRYGQVLDRGDGSYVAQICPLVAGRYEVHVLLNGEGVSNQPFQLLNPLLSRTEPQGLGSHMGDYIDGSPYELVVKHGLASAVTSTAEGPGLLGATVGVPVSFMVTVRDPYDNVLRSPGLVSVVSAKLDRSPSAWVSVWDLHNGSYIVEYIPQLDGPNLVSVRVNGSQILHSPFSVPVLDGATSADNSYAVGPGLVVGTTGETSYFEVFAFDLLGNRKTTSDDLFTFTVSGANSVDYTAFQSCPQPPQPDHPICSATDALRGHYFAHYVPVNAGPDVVQVFQGDDAAATPLSRRALSAVAAPVGLRNAVFRPTVLPSAPKATATDISGETGLCEFTFCVR